MKKIYILLVMVFSLGTTSAQIITFNGCHGLFNDQNFIFNNTATDGNGKKIYITTPVDGDQSCGGLGTCEFKIQWNNALTRWEFLADSGNGDFINPYLIYYNSTGNNSAANPPNTSTGSWVENVLVTENACGGNLTPSNSVMTGDLHTSTLAVNDFSKGQIQMFPNPVLDYITIKGIDNAKNIVIINMEGQEILKTDFKDRLDVTQLQKGVYFLRINDTYGKSYSLKFIKK